MPNKNIYFNQETNSLLEDLSKKLGKPFSQVIEIALNKYRDDVENRAMTEFRLCYDALNDSIMNLQVIRDYGNNEGCMSPEPWTDQDDEILELLFKAYEPLMNFNNAQTTKMLK